MKKGKIFAKVVSLVTFLVILYLFFPSINELIQEPPALQSFTITKNFEFEFKRVIEIEAIGTYTINITIPQENPYQKVKVVDESHFPKRVLKITNRTVWSYTFTGNAKIILRYSGNTSAKIWNIKDSLGINDIPEDLIKKYNHKEYLLDEHNQKIWVINPQPFKNVTFNITKDKKSVVDKLKAIYDIIQSNFHYVSERSGLPQDAITTWNSGEGDCDEISFVFVSMARSIGIPAWVEYGLLYTGTSWGPHAWVATIIPTSKGPVKVNIDMTTELDEENYGRGFLIRDPFRITLWEDDGNSEHMTSYYRFIVGQYINLHYEDKSEVIKALKSGDISIGIEESRIPQWVIIAVVASIVIIVIFIIIKI